MDTYRAMQDALNIMEYARSLKRLNEELYEHLHGSILYIIRYAEKNRITLLQKKTPFSNCLSKLIIMPT